MACDGISDFTIKMDCLKNLGVLSTVRPYILFGVSVGSRELQDNKGEDVSEEPAINFDLGLGLGLDYDPTSPLLLGASLIYEYGGGSSNTENGLGPVDEDLLAVHTLRFSSYGGYKFGEGALLALVEYMHHWYRYEPSNAPNSGNGISLLVRLRASPDNVLYPFLDFGREFSLSNGIEGWLGRVGLGVYFN